MTESTVRVRYFAAAAEAAGTPEEQHTVRTVGELRRAMVERHGDRLARVLERCSLVAAGVRVSAEDSPLTDGVTVDVLPPFAGG